MGARKVQLGAAGSRSQPAQDGSKGSMDASALRTSKELGIAVDPTTIELTPLKIGDRLVDYDIFSPITDGHIVTFRTNDLTNATLPHRDLFMM